MRCGRHVEVRRGNVRFGEVRYVKARQGSAGKLSYGALCPVEVSWGMAS